MVVTVIRRLRPVIPTSSAELGRPLASREPAQIDDRASRDLADALLGAAGRGDRVAFAEFYDLTSPLVFGLLRGALGEAGAADRATEEVYLQMWRRAPEFDPLGRSARAAVLFIACRELAGRVDELCTSCDAIAGEITSEFTASTGHVSAVDSEQPTDGYLRKND